MGVHADAAARSRRAARAASRPGRSHLLMKVSSGSPRVAADLEQLERLGLDALGRVEHHHRGVGRGQHPVGVLGEVAVAGGVEQVHDVVAVGELQHRRGDRDAALLLQLHPVRRGRPPALAGLDRPGAGGEGAAVEQELLGEGGLAGVGVADDGEGAAPGRLAHRLGDGLCGRGHRGVQSAQRPTRSRRWCSARNPAAGGRLDEGRLEPLLDRHGHGEVGHDAAVGADQVVVVAGQVLGQLEPGELVAAGDALDHPGGLQHAEVAVHRALREALAPGDHLGGGEGAVGLGQDPDQGLAVGRVALARPADTARHLDVEVVEGGGGRGGHGRSTLPGPCRLRTSEKAGDPRRAGGPDFPSDPRGRNMTATQPAGADRRSSAVADPRDARGAGCRDRSTVRTPHEATPCTTTSPSRRRPPPRD